jgi:tetratricopeptide (TPR) repeat protein
MAYYNRGYWYEVTEKYALAISDYKKALEIDKQFAEAYFALAYSYSKSGDNINACETLNSAKNKGIEAANELMEQFCK